MWQACRRFPSLFCEGRLQHRHALADQEALRHAAAKTDDMAIIALPVGHSGFWLNLAPSFCDIALERGEHSGRTKCGTASWSIECLE